MDPKSAISLYDLSHRIKKSLEDDFEEAYWIIAELSQISEHYSGHCYLELIEKNPQNDQLMANMKATIWSSSYRIIKPYFETTTGQSLRAGIKLMLKVQVIFHEIYGISLNVKDIEPSFTIGDQARKRKEILDKLEADGVLTMNQELVMPLVPQKIAIISSQTAAGFEDFVEQLASHPAKYKFYHHLFPASMQGSNVPESIMAALDHISAFDYFFDVVVLIRGGGSKTDLSYFDDFELGYYITQFPLPVITGIGHERDESIVDLVAHTRCKTPTAVAAFLIEQVESFETELDGLHMDIANQAKLILNQASNQLTGTSHGIQSATSTYLIEHEQVLTEIAYQSSKFSNRFIDNQQQHLKELILKSNYGAKRRIQYDSQYLESFSQKTVSSWRNILQTEKSRIQLVEQQSRLSDPRNLLKKGYSITTINGKILKDAEQVRTGDLIDTFLAKGRVKSTIVDPVKPLETPIKSKEN